MSQFFEMVNTPLAGLYRIERNPIADERGFFSRFFCADEFRGIGFKKNISQINHTLTFKKGTVRGMHFQYPPHTETKIVTCIRGEVLDVAVDIRKDSPTFLQWHAEVLSERNQSSFYIPDGFAHGFQTLTDDCHLIYLHSTFYAPNAEGVINVFDPTLVIDWPLEVKNTSKRDRNHPLLDAQFSGIEVS